MNKIHLGSVNGVAITVFQKDEQYLVPIKPICRALGIDDKAQRAKILEDEYLAQTVVISTSVGADGCHRETFSLPLFFIPRWLFSINPKKAVPEAMDKLIEDKWGCYQILYNKFFGSFIESSIMSERAREIRKKIEDEENRLASHQKETKQIKSNIHHLTTELRDITEKIINPGKHLFNS